MICLAQLSVIFSLRKSDIAPDGRSDILFAFETSNARSAYHCRRQYHARSAYHSPQANRVGAPALSQVRPADNYKGSVCRLYIAFPSSALKRDIRLLSQTVKIEGLHCLRRGSVKLGSKEKRATRALFSLERITGLEPATSTLARWRSTK